ncbi:MAG: hypothetical protein HOU81_00975 [Hamadaea sp.]|uniref:SAM-dependent methyltransferase n=1 Tax=Hamadaea sp. TaxID=2024425 RepID=UPI00185C8709|nr:SAM-dependent methyltransferase [Hamadaea sp.]NUR69370.1 hypothetical protein [Hamadaea sp.]NUT23187.1 hypothetical protein [Hamadaea sp.]
MTVQPSAPSTARMIDFWLGGYDHFPVDIAAAEAFEQAYGPCAAIFRSLRAFLGRTVRFVADQGITDFVVFGAGIPSQGNVHQIAPEATVLYTDADPKIVAHGSALLAMTDNAHYIEADATALSGFDPSAYLPGWGSRPVGVIFLGLAAFLDDEQLSSALRQLYAAVEPGSFLVVDFDGLELTAYPEALAMMGPGFHMRDPAEFERLLGDWRVDGIVPVAQWHPEGEPEPVPDAFWGGVAVKPR